MNPQTQYFNFQLPLLFGLRILEYLAPSVAPYLVGRTGYQLFLTDGKPNEPPLLLQMSSDCDDLKFMWEKKNHYHHHFAVMFIHNSFFYDHHRSSLASFQSRFLYANMSYDRILPFIYNFICYSSIPKSKILLRVWTCKFSLGFLDMVGWRTSSIRRKNEVVKVNIKKSKLRF